MAHGAEHTQGKKSKKAVKIGIKYCGGCNPCYERTDIVQTLARNMPEAEIVAAAPGCEVDHVAVICGCTRACAAHEGLQGRCGKTVVTAPKDCESLMKNIHNINGNGH